MQKELSPSQNNMALGVLKTLFQTENIALFPHQTYGVYMGPTHILFDLKREIVSFIDIGGDHHMLEPVYSVIEQEKVILFQGVYRRLGKSEGVKFISAEKGTGILQILID